MERDPKYRAFIRKFRCVACYRLMWHEYAKGDFPEWDDVMRRPGYGAGEAAHTGPHGISQKASDYTCVPLCRHHHHELDHQLGKPFWNKHGLQRLKLIAKLRAQYAVERTK